MKDFEKKEHESYGLVSLTRVNSSQATLFGSSIQHKNTMLLTVRRAEHHRGLNNDWYHGRGIVCEIELSQSQFAEMITTPNVGQGVPCTIRIADNKRMENPPFESKKDLFKKEFQKQMKQVTEQDTLYMKEALDILQNKSSIGKADRETIMKAFHYQLAGIKSSMPFIYEQFNEQMDKTVTEAKAEVEAFVEHKIRSVGIDAIKENAPKLLAD